MAIIVGTGFLSAQGSDPAYEVLFGPSYNSQKIGSYTASWTVTVNKFKWNIVNFNNNNNNWTDNIRCGRNKNASTASIYNASAITEKISSVVINAQITNTAAANKVNSAKVQVADNSNFTNATEYDIDLSSLTQKDEAKDITVNILSPAANMFYKIVFDMPNTNTANGWLRLNNIKFYAGEAKTPSEITFPQATYTANYGQPFDAPKAEVKAGNGKVTYSSDKESVATVNAETGAVTIIAGGTATITAKISETTEYASATASYTLEVKDVRPESKLAFAKSAYTAYLNKAFESPVAEVETGDGSVSYSSGNTAVATVNAETGEVALVAAGTTTITATIAATNNFLTSTASYTLTVVDIDDPLVYSSALGEDFTFEQTESYPWTHDKQ